MSRRERGSARAAVHGPRHSGGWRSRVRSADARGDRQTSLPNPSESGRGNGMTEANPFARLTASVSTAPDPDPVVRREVVRPGTRETENTATPPGRVQTRDG